MRTSLIGIASGLVALVGFASTANASATIDLLWGGENASTSEVVDSSNITLHVILTAGAAGSQGGGVTVDYSAAVGKLTIDSFSNNPNASSNIMPIALGLTTDTGSQIRNINAAALPPYVGSGLTSGGASYLLGTITFHKTAGSFGSFAITSVLTASDGILNLAGGDITGSTTFNSATLVNPPPIPEPGTVSLLALGMGGLALASRRKT